MLKLSQPQEKVLEILLREHNGKINCYVKGEIDIFPEDLRGELKNSFAIFNNEGLTTKFILDITGMYQGYITESAFSYFERKQQYELGQKQSAIHIGDIFHIEKADKVYSHSTDNSINMKNINDLFDNLVNVTREKIGDNKEILDAIQDMKDNVGKESFKQKLDNFIAIAANVMTIFSPFIPLLTELL